LSREGLGVNADGYEELLRQLGFRNVRLHKRLAHPQLPLAVQFNCSADGEVYFTAPSDDAERFPATLWRQLPPRDKKDAQRRLIALTPVSGKEALAFRELLGNPVWDSNVLDDREEQNIRRRRDITPAAKKQLALARQGQGAFRQNLEKLEQACKLTGLLDRRHLRARHIKPWRDCDDREKLDGNNGLLLSPHIAHLFDRGYITFSDDGELKIAASLNPAVLECWKLSPATRVARFRSEQCVYLEHHRQNVFERNAR
jgi:hypothetical protein